MQRGILLILLAAVLWGTTGISARYINDVYPLSPLTIGAWRLLFASPILILISYLSKGNEEPLQKPHLGIFLIYGITVATYQLSFFSAVTLAMVSTATLIAICTSPVFVAILSRLFLKERLNIRVFLALVLSISGTILIMDIYQLNFSLDSDQSLGYLLALGAGLSYATYAVAGKSLLAHYSPLRIVSITFSLGALFMLPFIPVPSDLPIKVWGILLFLGVVPTALAYIIFTTGLKSTTATSASIASLFEPLTATFLALTFIGERLSLIQSIGAILLFSALAIISVRKAA
ncbi:permease of the drug/metabolite transporter (dmt) superfamily [hydrocarbon metagenome]|uniref:Permease of the drug/metabolite transporter (Dmt) superfamily n=1 Tax=hydrocarbon metagenome TaxID=938273 RepID=A0A0W8E2M3_9ZZZZ